MIKKLLKRFVEGFPRAAQFYRNSRDLLDRNEKAIKTPWGFTLAGHPAMASGSFEPEETRLIRDLLLEVDIFVNVGANVGYYCCHALSLGKQVIAVEPIVRNLHYLLRNIRENGWAGQAEIFPVAVGEKADVLEMWGGGTGASLVKGWANISENYVTQVPVLSIDRLLGNKLHGKKALVLVDIEGAEYMMLQGARQTLSNEPKPVWMMEISSSEHQPTGIAMNPNLVRTFDMFFAHGYAIRTADEAAIQITPKIVAEVMAGRRKLDTHNFVMTGCEP